MSVPASLDRVETAANPAMSAMPPAKQTSRRKAATSVFGKIGNLSVITFLSNGK